MNPKREYKDYLTDIVEAMNSAMKFVENMNYSDFLQDDKTTSAVIQKLGVIGEATKNIPDEIRNEYPQIPWKDIAGMRDKLIHEYFGADLKRIWQTIKEDLPKIKPEIKEILRKNSSSARN